MAGKVLLVVMLLAWSMTMSAPVLASGELGKQSSSEQVSPTESGMIPYKSDDVISTGMLLRIALVVLFSIGMAFAAAFGIKKFFYGQSLGGGGSQRVKILEVKRLSAKSLLFLVQVDEREILLAQAGDNVTIIDKKHSSVSGHDISDINSST